MSVDLGIQEDVPQRIALPWGYIELSNNEVTLVSTVDDPPKWRLASLHGSLGGVTFSLVRPDGSGLMDELVLVQGKKDERTRGRDDVNYGELTLHVKAPPRFHNDDGLVLVALALHDYVWIKGLSPTPTPEPPALTLPPPVEPPQEPPPPIDEWLLPENQAKHAQEINRIRAEVSPMPLDEGRVTAYMQGRNRNLAEVHDDELNRSGLEVDPCGGVNRVPL